MIANIGYPIFEALGNAVILGLFFMLIGYLMKKSMAKNKVEFEWWEYIFYIPSLVCLFSPLFWFIMYFIYWSRDEETDKFINKKFHERMIFWGMLVWLGAIVVIYFNVAGV